jgi:hypothetical protein
MMRPQSARPASRSLTMSGKTTQSLKRIPSVSSTKLIWQAKPNQQLETIAALKKENAALKKALKNTLWMAAEYAKVQSAFSAYTVNKAMEVAEASGVNHGAKYVSDEYLGRWIPNFSYFEGTAGVNILKVLATQSNHSSTGPMDPAEAKRQRMK